MTVLTPDELYTLPALSALVFVTSTSLKCCRGTRCAGKLGEFCVSCTTTFEVCHSVSQYLPCLQRPRTEEQVPTVNQFPSSGIRDTANASGVQVAMANVQPESSLRGSLKTYEPATAGGSAGAAFRQADGTSAAGYHVNSSDRSPVQSADKSKTQQVAPKQVSTCCVLLLSADWTGLRSDELTSLIDTAATQLADEQLKTSRACTSDGDHIDSARIDDALSHGRDSGTEGLTMEAEVSFHPVSWHASYSLCTSSGSNRATLTLQYVSLNCFAAISMLYTG